MSTGPHNAAPSTAATSNQPDRRGPVVHGPEKRLFDGMRTWTDMFPWLRLVRVCRIAGGPVWITHTLIVSLVWFIGFMLLSGLPVRASVTSGVAPILGLPLVSSMIPSDAWAALPGGTFAARTGVPLDWKNVVWTILMWLPTMMALLRVGAILTAGRDIPSYITTFRAVGGRLRGAAVIVLLPAVVAGFFVLIAWSVTWLAVAIGGESGRTSWVTLLSLPVALPAMLIAGLMVLGGKLAVPLGLTAVMIEPDADPIDALSRGFEYTLRRLPQFALLALVAVAISAVVVLGWFGLSLAARSLAMSFAPTNPPLILCLALLPSVIAVMMLWSMLGGIYLLLRQSAGGQEVEDLAIDPGHWKSPKMPSVQVKP